MSTQDKQQLIDHWEAHIRELVQAQASKLRRLADDLDREAVHARTVHGLVQTAMHTVAWGIANLNQDQMVSWLQQIESLRSEPSLPNGGGE